MWQVLIKGFKLRVVIQRVSEAAVRVDGEVVGEIGQGLLVLVCAEPGDTATVREKMLRKIVNLRIFADEQGKMNRSVLDVGGSLLIVSQFTLAADVSRGNRPSFTGAAEPGQAKADYDAFLKLARTMCNDVQSGIFGADMKVHLVNDGPVTIPIEMRQE